MSAHDVSTAFDELVAGYDQNVQCVWFNKARKWRCRRVAHWHLDAHGCFGGPLCGQHLSEWKRTYAGARRCEICGRIFPSFTAAFTARKL